MNILPGWSANHQSGAPPSVVAIEQTASAGASGAGGVHTTPAARSIGTAAPDRVVVAAVAVEDTDTITSCEIWNGSGYTAMTAGTGTFRQGSIQVRMFWIPWPTGTDADFRITYSGAVSAAHLFLFKVTGANPTPAVESGDASTDMDSTDPLTTGSITIPTNGGFVGVAAGATNGNAKTWANAGEVSDIDDTVGFTFRITSAISTTPGTVTVTVTGTSNGEDGALAYLIFNPA